MIPIANPIITDEEKELVNEVMDSGMLIMGKYVKEFEEKFANYSGTKYGIATSSGTTALDVAVKSLKIEEGDKIITTPFTFIASSNSILYSKADPIFADVKEDTFNIDPDSVRELLKEHPDTKALMIVHLYGLSCDMDEIMEIVNEHNLLLIEDSAQAHGATYKGRKVGSFGDVSAFSFYPTKNMTTSEGGIVLTDDKEVMERARLILNHGSPKKYHHDILGYNYRMTNISAAIGLVQFKKLDQFNKQRQKNARRLTEGLSDLTWLQTPVVPADRGHVFHQYTVKVDDREEFLKYLQEKEIGYGIHYPMPVYEQKLYKDLGYKDTNCPVSEKLCDQVVSLPVHPALSDEDIDYIIESLRDFK
ncbi:MAG: DegT/DnrJ/EryC1/StrS family aminotransferase [Halanaerobiales bacterium]|nr:DegT/DnrJ/EryC1/StrS family aminotransferase [Halanaerobiales bacterium]